MFAARLNARSDHLSLYVRFIQVLLHGQPLSTLWEASSEIAHKLIRGVGKMQAICVAMRQFQYSWRIAEGVMVQRLALDGLAGVHGQHLDVLQAQFR